MLWYYKMREKFGHLSTENDEDLRTYQTSIKAQIQQEGYKKGSLVQWVQDRGHHVLRRMNRFDGEHCLLEIGCGLGRHLGFVPEENKQNYVAMDFDFPLLQKASAKHDAPAFIAGSVLQLPFPADTFDGVLSTYVLEHIQDLDQAFTEIKRVLKPNGKLLLALPTEGGLFWDLGRRLVVKPAFEKKYHINYDKIIAWEHRHSITEIMVLMRNYFEIETKKYIPFVIPSYQFNLVFAVKAKIRV